MKSSPLRFAVIGSGILARQTHIPNLAAMPETELHTCCDLDDESLRLCEPFGPKRLSKDFREVVADPEVDALVVATTERFRVPIIEAAAAAGKPVYTEKPLADTIENARRIQQLVKESGIPFCVGHNRRCSPAMVEAQEIFTRHMRAPQPLPWRFNRPGWEKIDVGGEDNLPIVNIRVNDDWHSWKAVHATEGLNKDFGLLLSEMTHFVDLACWFLEDEPRQIWATGTGKLNHTIVLHFKKRGMATITSGSNGSFAYPKELLEAVGAGGVVVVDHMLEVRSGGISGAPAVKTYPVLSDRHPNVGTQGGLHGWLEKKRVACEEAVAAGDPMLQFTAEPDKGHRRMLAEFVREIRGERPPVSPVDSAVTAARICLAAVKSVQENRSVDLEEI